ncbi:hypothetical protein CDD83_9400 [Cordyceps sp. RAO-2017]|nr:hypothetical protein CDD83_9400 [Cordyceps sp. RAO-2017]
MGSAAHAGAGTTATKYTPDLRRRADRQGFSPANAETSPFGVGSAFSPSARAHDACAHVRGGVVCAAVAKGSGRGAAAALRSASIVFRSRRPFGFKIQKDREATGWEQEEPILEGPRGYQEGIWIDSRARLRPPVWDGRDDGPPRPPSPSPWEQARGRGTGHNPAATRRQLPERPRRQKQPYPGRPPTGSASGPPPRIRLRDAWAGRSLLSIARRRRRLGAFAAFDSSAIATPVLV